MIPDQFQNNLFDFSGFMLFFFFFCVVSVQWQRWPGDALQGGQRGSQDGALSLHGIVPWKVQKHMEKGKKQCPTLGILHLKTHLGIAAQRSEFALSCWHGVHLWGFNLETALKGILNFSQM